MAASQVAFLATDSETRTRDRRSLQLEVVASGALSRSTARIHNLSETGLLLEGVDVAIGELIDLDLPHVGSTSALVVWTNGRAAGCNFIKPLTPATISASLLRADARTILPEAANEHGLSHHLDGAAQAVTNGFTVQSRFYIITGLAIACWSALGSTIWWVL